MCELLKQFFSKILRTISQTTFYVLFNPRLYFFAGFFWRKDVNSKRRNMTAAERQNLQNYFSTKKEQNLQLMSQFGRL